mgnify:CR=1 FL=1
MARFVRPKPWTDAWLEYMCMEHPIGRVVFIILSVFMLWAMMVLIMCL